MASLTVSAVIQGEVASPAEILDIIRIFSDSEDGRAHLDAMADQLGSGVHEVAATINPLIGGVYDNPMSLIFTLN